MRPVESRRESKTRLLNAAMHVIRAKGYSATRIEDVCEAAGQSHIDQRVFTNCICRDVHGPYPQGLQLARP
jgi:hypothetical protein